MANQTEDNKKKDNKEAPLPPDPETLHTTDPQENMKGPVSSAMQGIKDNAEKNNTETKEEADRKKDKNT